MDLDRTARVGWGGAGGGAERRRRGWAAAARWRRPKSIPGMVCSTVWTESELTSSRTQLGVLGMMLGRRGTNAAVRGGERRRSQLRRAISRAREEKREGEGWFGPEREKGEEKGFPFYKLIQTQFHLNSNSS